MDPSFERGLSGGALPPAGNFDEWEKGRCVHDANQAELARQAQGWSQPQPAWEPVVPASGQWSSSGTYGGARGTWSPAAATATVNLLLGVAVLVSANWLLALLYPVASVTASVLAMIGVVLQQGHPDVSPAILLVPGSVVAFWMVSRFEHRLAQRSAFRRIRHVVRLLIVATVVYAAMAGDSPVLGGPSFASVIAVCLVVAGIHVLLTKATTLRARWHGVLEAIRLRPKNLQS